MPHQSKKQNQQLYVPRQRNKNNNLETKENNKTKMFLTFFAWISTVYGAETGRLLKDIASTQEKLARLRNRRIFMIKCRQTDIIPKCLRTKWNHLSFNHIQQKMNNWKQKIEFELLNMAISEIHAEIGSLDKKLRFLNRNASHHLPVHIIDKFNKCQKIKYEKIFNKTKMKQTEKFEVLVKEKMEKFKKMANDRWIENISDTNVPDYVTNILSLGPNFGLPYERKRLPIINILSSIENALYKNDKAEEIRAKVVNVTTNFTNEYKRSKNADKCLLLLVNRTKKYLAENEQIAVINADKGKKTIILNTSEYNASMEKLVNDKETYIKTKRDPTTRIETLVNELITTWRLNNKIDDKQEQYLKTHNSVAPAVYGLGKLHKKKSGESIPLRPVVCTVQSPTYKISQMLAKTFSKMNNDSPYHVKDSWQFAQDIKNVRIPNGYKLISLDATSLFTNVPTSLCVAAIKSRWNQIKPHTFLTQKQFIEVVRLITSESYFRYKDDFYLQQTGLAMGNAISGFLADMVMEELETKVLRNLPFRTPFYKRYVDDIIVAVPENESETIRSAFNKYHKRLQFTIEEESDKSINFLDMTLRRTENGEISTTWYQKEIASGRYLHFEGHNSMTHKRNVATAITDRAIAFTNPTERPKSLMKVNELLAENGYPKPFISKIIKNRVDRFYNGKQTESRPKQRFIASPYVPGLSERLKKVLNPYNLTLSCKTTNKIGDLYTRTKYKVPKQLKSKVVYQVNCNVCSATYVGMTKQKVKKRMAKHKSDIHLKKRIETTGLTIHAIDNKHDIDFDNVTILEQIPNYFQRAIAEKMYIHRTENTVNTQVDKAGLHGSYINLLKNQIKRKPKTKPLPTTM